MLTLLAILLAVLILGYGGWFLFELARYVLSGEYAVDKRLREVTR